MTLRSRSRISSSSPCCVEWPRQADAGVVDQDVEVEAALAEARVERPRRVRLRDVEGDRQRRDGKVALDRGGCLLQRARIARDERHVAAGLGEAAGKRQPDAARGSGYDDGGLQMRDGLQCGLGRARVACDPQVGEAAEQGGISALRALAARRTRVIARSSTR